MPLDQRDKVVRTFTLRQKWPRNVDLNQKPHWMHINTHSPFPSNVKYGRPRSIDRSPFGGGGLMEDNPDG